MILRLSLLGCLLFLQTSFLFLFLQTTFHPVYSTLYTLCVTLCQRVSCIGGSFCGTHSDKLSSLVCLACQVFCWAVSYNVAQVSCSLASTSLSSSCCDFFLLCHILYCTGMRVFKPCNPFLLLTLPLYSLLLHIWAHCCTLAPLCGANSVLPASRAQFWVHSHSRRRSQRQTISVVSWSCQKETGCWSFRILCKQSSSFLQLAIVLVCLWLWYPASIWLH